MNFKDHEEKLSCPYNEAHLIMRKRMEVHLVRCRKNYTGEMKLVECDFNHNHRVYEPELTYHHETCHDRKNIESVVYQEESEDLLDPYKIVNIPTPSEEWDDNPNLGYNPLEATEGKEILRHMDVASAAKKRTFRLNERKRVQGIATNPQPRAAAQKAKPKPKIEEKLPTVPVPKQENIKENLPDNILELMRRVRIGEEKVYIPKAPETK